MIASSLPKSEIDWEDDVNAEDIGVKANPFEESLFDDSW